MAEVARLEGEAMNGARREADARQELEQLQAEFSSTMAAGQAALVDAEMNDISCRILMEAQADAGHGWRRYSLGSP